MKWEKVEIQSVCEGIYDGPHATPPISDTGAIFLGISNITQDGHLDFSNVKYISEKDLPKWTKRVTPRKNDIVFSYEATLNLYAKIPENFWGCLGRRMALIRPNPKKISGDFLYYYFFSDQWRNVIAENIVTGATVDRIPLIRFPTFLINIPPLKIQQKIASILSAYDDLIENNKKQIKLLEEAAQRLYKEWFVDLRFPGHESAKIVDGIPEGWQDGTVELIAPFKRGKTITKEKAEEGNIPVVAGGLEPAYYHNVSNANGPVVTVSASGANAGYIRIYYENIWASDCSFCDCKISKYWSFIYCFLKENKKTIDSLQKGSAQPHVYAKDINAINLNIPGNNLLNQFINTVEIFFKRIGMLERQNKIAIEARNRLLPKLMSGKIEV